MTVEVIAGKAYLNLQSGKILEPNPLLIIDIDGYSYTIEAKTHLGGQRLSLPQSFLEILETHKGATTLKIALSRRKCLFIIEGKKWSVINEQT